MTERYPTDEELEEIKKWPIDKPGDCGRLLEFVESIWAFHDWGWKRRGRTFWVSTAGWSGNESIMGALMENRFFWMFSWYSSRRGGHYVFKVMKHT